MKEGRHSRRRRQPPASKPAPDPRSEPVNADPAPRSPLAAAAAGPPADFQRDFEMYDSAPVGFYTLDRGGRICDLNETGANLLGFTSSWLRGKVFVAFVARQDVHRFLDALRESIRVPGSRLIEVDMFVADRTQPVQIALATSAETPSAFHRLTVVDLTDVRNTERLLNESLANWHSLVQSAPDVIMTLESGGRVTFLNKPLWGYSIDAVIGTNILDHVPESERPKLQRCLQQCFRFKRRPTCEIVDSAGEKSRWFHLSFGAPHNLNANGPSAEKSVTTLMIREISAQKRMEEALRLSGEQLRGFAARLEGVREEERARLAHEIHDELGQALTALKLELAWVQRRIARSGDIRTKMNSLIAHVDETIERVRRISYELRPAILDDLGLIPAIDWLVREFRKRTGIRADLVSDGEGLILPTEAAVALFRVVQEALTNVMRHAQASRVRVRVHIDNHTLRMSIEDNGRGMREVKTVSTESFGIIGMKERITRLGGEFVIGSKAGKGVRINIVIPRAVEGLPPHVMDGLDD